MAARCRADGARDRRAAPAGAAARTRGRRSSPGRVAFPRLAALIGEPIAVERAVPDRRAGTRADRPAAGGRRDARHLSGPDVAGCGRRIVHYPGRRAAGTLGRCPDAASQPTPPNRLERPADPAVRKANLRRIFPLFRAYRPQLAVVFALIIFSAALGVIPAFLLKEVLDTAIPENDVRLLTALVAGMILIPIVTGAIGVYQTLLSNRVGQAVMHDLRTSVYRHLQRLSLAFFTRTRTGDVQSRIANDIGGIDTVVTSTATSVLSNVTTVIATVVAMILLDWRLAAVRADPAAALRLADEAGRRPAQEGDRGAPGLARRRLVDRAGVALGLGDPARQDDGPLRRPRGAVLERVAPPRRPRGAKPDDRPLDDGGDPDDVRRDAGARLLVRRLVAGARQLRSSSIGTLVAFTTLQTRLFFPIGSLLGVQLEVQSSLALFDRIFDYLDQPIDIVEGTRTLDRPRGDVAFDRRLLPLRRRRLDAEGRLVHGSGGHEDGARRRDRLRARRPAATSSRASTTRPRAPSRSTGSTSAS